MQNRSKEKPVYRVAKPLYNNTFDDISKIRNRQDKSIVFAVDADTSLRDFYYKYARGLATVDTLPIEITEVLYADAIDNTTKAAAANKNFYELHFTNKGGLVMPLIIEWTFKDGSKEINRIPAQIWRKNENKVTKVFLKDKEVTGIRLDPMRETADIDENNNIWPAIDLPNKFQLYKSRQNNRGQSSGVNPMQKQTK
ncbi:MAG: hypothetical protein WKF59_01645 [Chitinophagaceae bacterium]